MDGLKTIMKFIPIPRSRWLPLGSSSGLNQPSRRVRRNGVHSNQSCECSRDAPCVSHEIQGHNLHVIPSKQGGPARMDTINHRCARLDPVSFDHERSAYTDG